MLLRGFAKGVPTKWLTDEMDPAYPPVLKRRHRTQEAVQREGQVGLPGEALGELPDSKVEADERYQNAGEKGSRIPIRMTRRVGGQTNREDEGPTKTTGLLSHSMVGRETGWVSFEVCPDTKKEPLQATVAEGTTKETTIFADENRPHRALRGGGSGIDSVPRSVV
jgi:hypothetical protein